MLAVITIFLYPFKHILYNIAEKKTMDFVVDIKKKSQLVPMIKILLTYARVHYTHALPSPPSPPPPSAGQAGSMQSNKGVYIVNMWIGFFLLFLLRC